MQAAACIGLLLMSVTTQPLMAQQTNVQPQTNPQPQTQTSPTAPAPQQPVVTDTTGTPGLPQAPQPKPTEPFFLRDTEVDYTKPKSHLWNPIAPYTSTNVPQARLGNTPQLDQLLRDGKIYLSLNDAVTLALQNNYDIEIARIEPGYRGHRYSPDQSRRHHSRCQHRSGAGNDRRNDVRRLRAAAAPVEHRPQLAAEQRVLQVSF